MQSRSFVCFAITVVALSACSSFQGFAQQEGEGLGKVDELLAHVERVQAESLLCKERSRVAYGALQTLVGPDFGGDAIGAYAELEERIAASHDQARKLAESVGPLAQSADDVFERWTADLESFGNTVLRQQSQSRMEETRARCDVVLRAARAADVACRAFNADLNDHALFLAHDLNASSVAAIAGAVDALEFQAAELDRRLDACATAARSYVQASALRGELAPRETTESVAEAPKPVSKSSTLRRKPAPAPTLAKAEPGPSSAPPEAPTPAPDPDSQRPR